MLAQNDFQDLLEQMDTEEREADRSVDLVKAEMVNATADQFANLSLGMSDIALLRDALDWMEQPTSQTAHRLEQVEDYLNSRILRSGNWKRSFTDGILQIFREEIY